jgi:hypothetical protein
MMLAANPYCRCRHALERGHRLLGTILLRVAQGGIEHHDRQDDQRVEDVTHDHRDNCCPDQYDRHHARKLPHQDLPAAWSLVVLNLVRAVLRQTPLHLGLSKA